MAPTRILIRGAVLAVVAVIIALTAGALGIDNLWPVLLAAAVGFAAVPLSAGRAGAFVAGVLIGWAAIAVQAALLPETAAAQAITVVIGIVLITAIAAATADLAPMWAGLAGYAAFAAFYAPTLAASPASWGADSFAAVVTVLLATALGFAAALLGDLVAALRPASAHEGLADGEVA